MSQYFQLISDSETEIESSEISSIRTRRSISLIEASISSLNDTITTSVPDTDELEQIALEDMTNVISRLVYNDQYKQKDINLNEEMNLFNLDPIYSYPEDNLDQNDEIIESDSSSFYDDEIPISELEYFSSEWDEENDSDNDMVRTIKPLPESRTINKLHRLLAKYQILKSDTPEKREAKQRNKLEIRMQFKDYCKRKKALKTIARHKLVEMMEFDNVYDEAEELMNFEILDKKLHRNFYYTKDEPKKYKKLLGKRIRAIIRKYNRYIEDKGFRESMKNKIKNLNVTKMKYSPLFNDEPLFVGNKKRSARKSLSVSTSEEDDTIYSLYPNSFNQLDTLLKGNSISQLSYSKQIDNMKKQSPIFLKELNDEEQDFDESSMKIIFKAKNQNYKSTTEDASSLGQEYFENDKIEGNSRKTDEDEFMNMYQNEFYEVSNYSNEEDYSLITDRNNDNNSSYERNIYKGDDHIYLPDYNIDDFSLNSCTDDTLTYDEISSIEYPTPFVSEINSYPLDEENLQCNRSFRRFNTEESSINDISLRNSFYDNSNSSNRSRRISSGYESIFENYQNSELFWHERRNGLVVFERRF